LARDPQGDKLLAPQSAWLHHYHTAAPVWRATIVGSPFSQRDLDSHEPAAHSGRLAEVDGFGREPVEMVGMALAAMLSGTAQRRLHGSPQDEGTAESEPAAELLLQVDDDYRRREDAGDLR